MKMLKKVVSSAAALLMASALFAQQKSEASVESDYLTSVQDVVITELATSEERDNKLVALQYLEAAVDEGNITPAMIQALDGLAGEGINTQSRTNGRLVNNFPDIRAKSCEILAKVPTEESKTILKNIALQDNEPMVITAAIRSLGEIGMNDGDDVVNTIAWASKKNTVLNPTSSLAMEVLVAYEKLADKVENKSEMIRAVSEIATNYNFVTPVRTKALQLLKTLNNSGKKSSSNAK